MSHPVNDEIKEKYVEEATAYVNKTYKDLYSEATKDKLIEIIARENYNKHRDL